MKVASENNSTHEKPSVLYTARFVHNIPVLLEKFPPKHTTHYGHHSTIAFKPSKLDDVVIGQVSTMKVIGRAFDEMGDALLVENNKSKNKHPHITLSCALGVPPVYSNQLIETAIASGTVQYFSEPYEIEVVEGYSDGKTDYTTP